MKPSRFALALVLTAVTAAPAVPQAPSVVAIWGSQSSGPVGFGHPNGVTIGPNGHAFIADQINTRVVEVTADGVYVTQYGAPATDTLNGPSKVAFSASGTMYVADGYACAISMWNGAAYGGWFGGCGVGPGQWFYSWGIAVQGGRVYVSDTRNYRVEVFDLSGQFQFSWPTGDLAEGLAVDGSGNIYVAQYAGRIGVYSPSGVLLSTIGSPGGGPGQLNSPYDVALDGAGNVYVADAYNHRIEVFTPGGAFVTAWGTRGSDPGQFIQPRGLAVGPDGRIYVADTWNDRIQVFGALSTPTRTTSWGRLKATYRQAPARDAPR
jgi:sugar lactone lactonase YvrE